MNAPPKIEAFRDIEYLKHILSKTGIGGFRPWRNDGYKWISFSDYYTFGNKEHRTGLQNNLAYYISSDIIEYAQEIKLILNINNLEAAKAACDTFIRISLKTFTALNLTPPVNMLSAIIQGLEFEYHENYYSSALQILKTSITSWILVIKSK
jgi:hypothetical protein